MTAKEVWESLPNKERIEAVNDRKPRSGYVFRCLISKTKMRWIEYQDGQDWRTVGLAPKKWKLTRKERTDG